MIQLKIRTEYSFGQTFAPIKRTVAYLKHWGCTTAGIVDTNTWGHVEWFKQCTAAGIKPLLGAEVVVSNDEERTPKMWFLALTTKGLGSLYKAMSLAHHQTIRTKRGTVPRLYPADVQTMGPDVAVFAGEVTDSQFLESVHAYMDIGPASEILNKKKHATGLPLVYVSDNAYVGVEDRAVFEVMARAGTKPTPQHILLALKQTEAMREIEIRGLALALPVAPMIHVEGDLELLCRKGIVERGLVDLWVTNQAYEKRLSYELDIIRQKDYESYFIVVADMVRYAKQHMLVGPSRGSAAGSMVCYLTQITEIDPIPPGLLFERFIDITRRDLPDIDLDFPDQKRHLVFEYMAKKYGQKNVAHIGTINTFAPKSALIQVCKAMGIPPIATAGVKAAMIERSSADARAMACLEDTLKQTEPGRQFLKAYPHAALCSQIEGHAKHAGVHAAGLLICPDVEIMNYATVDDENIAHIEMSAATALGLLKIDVLGLRTLTVLEDSGIEVDWYKLPLDDPKTYEVFNQGRLCGIFQFEGDAMRSIASQMTIDKISDVDAVTALARPGPFAGGVTFKYLRRKNEEEPVEAIHPLVEPFMRLTYGLPIYQEQTLAICREIGNFGWKEAAIIRKAMSKSLGVEFFNQYWEQFRDGAATHGIDVKTAKATWEMIMTMGSWQMNKAHTYSYAVISYWCAWLKANHPLDFAASTLRNAHSEESAAELLREMVKEGFEYVPFDPDLSEVNWSVKNGKLVGGFMALKGLGEITAKALVAARSAGTMTQQKRDKLLTLPNPFTDLFPIKTRHGAKYDKPWKYNLSEAIICDEITTIDKLLIEDKKHCVPSGHHRWFIGTLINKNPHGMNEEANVKKRGGPFTPPKDDVLGMEYLDLRLRDDTGTIGGRVSREKYLAIGLEITEDVPIGTDLLVRAVFYHRQGKYLPYAFIVYWERLDGIVTKHKPKKEDK